MPPLFSIVLEVAEREIKKEKYITHTNHKEKLKLSLLVDDMSLYIEKTKESTKILKLIKFMKVTKYKINAEKSIVVLLYTRME